MPLSVDHIFTRLYEWPHRGTGTEEEMMARETLITELVGEPGVEVAEQGLMVPANYIAFFWMLCAGQAAAVLLSGWSPLMALLAGIVLFISHLLFFDWRISPLVWMVPRALSANLVASKGDGKRLVILMAHLDSAPASYAYRRDQVKHFSLSVYLGTLLMGFGVILPWMMVVGIALPLWILGIVAAFLVAQAVLTSIDYWKHGYTPGANDNLTGVSAAVAAASNLWRHMPDNTEVRLVITTGEEAGMLGAQHYWRAHEYEMSLRDTHVLNFDTVGSEHLKYVIQSGGFTPVRYQGPLVDAAHTLSNGSEGFRSIRPAQHRVGDFDSVWFCRAGISSLTIASYDKEGMMPAIHTPQDTADRVNLRNVALAAKFGEGIVRTLPPIKG